MAATPTPDPSPDTSRPGPSPDAADVPATARAGSSGRPRGDSLKLKQLVDRVAEATGGKKKGLREVVEAVLHQLGEALARGDELNLPGLGRGRVARAAEKNGAAHLTLKLKRAPHKKRDTAAKEPLADDAEEG